MRNDIIIKTVCFYYPDVSAIYLFGSYSTEYERMDSDVDIALLLP
ncbi:MAG: nucleotidyltransferase domain-containing protein, partial [Planctomycetota bacterium]